MHDTLKRVEGTEHSGFKAWGICFSYAYDPKTVTLKISTRGYPPELFIVKKAKALEVAPLLYVDMIEKATQISALMYSNNQSIELPEILESSKLQAILKGAARLAEYATTLKQEEYGLFAKEFCRDFHLKGFEFETLEGQTPEVHFYTARIETHNGNAITARATSLHSIMKKLSLRTMRDLILSESGLHLQKPAQHLLCAATKFSNIERLLNQNFIPLKQLESKNFAFRQANNQA